MSLLWVSLRLELPCSPFMPMQRGGMTGRDPDSWQTYASLNSQAHCFNLRYQTMIPDGGNTPVCKGIFGMLMLNTSTMSSLAAGASLWLHMVPNNLGFRAL